jgi:hypothetical protein
VQFVVAARSVEINQGLAQKLGKWQVAVSAQIKLSA